MIPSGILLAAKLMLSRKRLLPFLLVATNFTSTLGLLKPGRLAVIVDQSPKSGRTYSLAMGVWFVVSVEPDALHIVVQLVPQSLEASSASLSELLVYLNLYATSKVITGTPAPVRSTGGNNNSSTSFI